jgi:ATP-dependent RNA helicase RhlE
MRFENLGLAEPIVRAVVTEGYTTPTPIQMQAMPHVLQGKDLMGVAQTGTGKTAAFALPILHRLHSAGHKAVPHEAPGAQHHADRENHHSGGRSGARNHHHRDNRHQAGPVAPPRTLILAPTRELASQISESFNVYGRNLRLRNTVIFGGVSQFHQVKLLRRGVDIIIATPGRLLDLMNQGHVDLREIEILVLDEADRMLDMGFIHDIRTIVKRVPVKRQTLMFSATMPGDIRALAASILRDPVHVQVTPVSSTVELIQQSVYFVQMKQKAALLAHLLKDGQMQRTLVFTRTKHGADKVVKYLMKAGVRAEAIHGNKSQNARTRALENFKSKQPPVLVATDIASRGIDVDGITHVVNFDVPNVAESYVHRIGRTARAGASGVAISFCDQNERGNLRAIERLTRTTIAVQKGLPAFVMNAQPEAGEVIDEYRPMNGHERSSRSGGGQSNGRRNGQGSGARKGHRGQRGGGHSPGQGGNGEARPHHHRAGKGGAFTGQKRNGGYMQRGKGRPR